MKALRQLAVILGCSGALAQAMEPPRCLSEDFSAQALAPIGFLYDARDGLPQRSLVADMSGPASWMEIEFIQGTLRIRNRMPELGLPAVFLWVGVDVLDGDGRVVPALSRGYPNAEQCAMTSLFPGQFSAPIKLPEWEQYRRDSELRVRVRVWIPSLD
jgi:hypothetical protein